MSIDQKKEKFEKYRVNLKELKRFAQEYKMLEDLTKILSPADTKETKNTIDNLGKEKLKLCKKVNNILKEKRAIEKEIDNVKNGAEAMLLRYRYIDGCDWEEISELLNYSPRNIHYMHKKALNEIAK